MKNAPQAVIVAALVILSAFHAVAQNELPLPRECSDVDFGATGRPVLFQFRNGLLLGISAPTASFSTKAPILLDVWVVNQTDAEQSVVSCSDVDMWTLDLQVYDSQWHLQETRNEREERLNPDPALKVQHELRRCFRNLALRIPPHSCAPLHDVGRVVTTDLAKRYDLPSGGYFVTQKKLTLPVRALSITVVDTKIRDGDVPSQ